MTEREVSPLLHGARSSKAEAERLRTLARRAPELARDVTDEEAARALKAHAAEFAY